MWIQRLVPYIMLLVCASDASYGAKDPRTCATLLTETTLWQYASKVAFGDYGLIREILSSKMLDQPALRVRKETVGEGFLNLQTEKGREFYLVELSNHEALIRTVEGKYYRLPVENKTAPQMVWHPYRDREMPSPHVKETPEGKIFIRVENPALDRGESGVCWKDIETGLVWSSPSEEKMNQEKAVEYCRSIGAELPTKAMLERLASSKGHQLFLNRNNWFWSSSIYPKGSGSFYVFNSDTGEFDFHYRKYDGDTVVCIWR